MAGICTDLDRDSGGDCKHRTAVVALDGTNLTLRFHDDVIDAIDWSAGPLPGDWQTKTPRELFALLGVKYARVRGISLDTLIGRVVNGEEATNVKQYTFFGPGAAITKTNIGTAYVNICPGLNGERIPVDFTGCTQFRFLLSANLVGTGQWGARCIRDNDNEVLIEQANLGAAGERDVDSDWQNLPAAFLGQGLQFLRVQGKSQTGADDPVFRRCQIGLK